MDKTPMWLKALPIEMQGGEQSETQKRLRNRISSPNLQMSALAPLYSLDSANYTKTATGGYTGHKNGKIVMDKVASKKTFEDHQGEEYIQAPLVAAAGGPEAVRKAILDLAQKRVAEAGTSSFKPIVDAPVITSKAEEAVGSKKTSFAAGGTVGDDENTTSVTGLNSAAPIGSAQADINRTTKLLRDTAEGINPYTNQIAEQAKRDEAARTAAGKSELQMRMTQTGLEGPAADTAMASFDRDARIRATTAAADVAKNQQAQALQATQALAPLAIGEREYQENAGADKTKRIGDMTSAIEGILSADPNTPVTDSVLNTYLDSLYAESGATEDKATWKANKVASIKQYQDQDYQTRNSITTDAAVRDYFNGDLESFNNFEWGGKTGDAAFRDAYTNWKNTGGMKLNSQGELVPDPDNAILKLLSNKPEIVSVDPTFTGNKGDSFVSGTDTYTVDTKNPDGSYSLSFGDGGRATAKMGTDGKLRLSITQESAENSKDGDGFTTTPGDLRQGTQRFSTKVTGTNQYVQVGENGEQYITVGNDKIGVTVDPIDGTIAYDNPFSANGKLYGTDGNEISTPQGKLTLTPEQATALNNGSSVTATARDGTLFKVGLDGSAIEYSTTDLAKEFKNSPTTAIANMDALISSGLYNANSLAEKYITTIGAGAIPNPVLLEYFAKANSPELKKNLPALLASGTVDLSRSPEVMKMVKDIANTKQPTGPIKGSVIAQSDIPSVGSIAKVGDKYYYVKSEAGRTDAGGKLWNYPRTLVALDGSGEITQNYLST